MRKAFVENLLYASGIDPQSRSDSTRRIVIPSAAKFDNSRALVNQYIRGTPYDTLFSSTLPFALPERARFEHCHILGGTGFVDIALLRGDEKIACEIAITTPVGKEIENIEKCFSAGYGTVWIISPNQKHLNSIRKMSSELAEDKRSSVVYLSPEDLPSAFTHRTTVPLESTVKGYRVRVRRAESSFDESKERRATVAEVLAKSAATVLKGKG